MVKLKVRLNLQNLRKPFYTIENGNLIEKLGNVKGKWQVKDEKNNVSFYDTNVSLKLSACQLINKSRISQKIFEGRNLPKKIPKQVCGWIACDSIELIKNTKPKIENKISFNPRVNPHWVLENENLDNFDFDFLITFKNNIYKF